MAYKPTPMRPCDTGCGRYVRIRGRVKLCDQCCSRCDCGARKSHSRPRCRDCSAGRVADDAEAEAIVWVKNRRGIFVARR